MVFTWLHIVQFGLILMCCETAHAQCDGTPMELTVENTWQTQLTPDHGTTGLGSYQNCSWTIKQSSPGSGVAFIVHDIEPTLTPSVDILFYSGSTADDANNIFRAAAATIYDVIYVENDDAHITVETNTTDGQKFQITFFLPQDQSAACSSVLYAEEKKNELSSPNFPGVYPDSTNCVWEFSSGAPLAKVYFKIIWISFMNGCADYIEIFNGREADGDSTLIEQLCPSMNLNNPDYMYNSTEEYAHIKFTSNFVGFASGFFIEYTSDNAETVVQSTFDTASITTPGYETNFMAYLDYKLKITDTTGAAGIKILIQIHDTDVPCPTGATVNIYDDSTDTDASKLMLQDGCGSDLQTILSSTGPDIFLRFRTADNTTGKGFRLSYTSFQESPDDNSENQFLNASDSVSFLSSQGFPSTYSSDASINYVISSGHDGSSVSVIIVFVDFAPPCAADHLKIYDGNIIDDPSLVSVQEYCSDTSSWSEIIYNSTGQYLSVVFTSDSTEQKSGFLLKYWVERHCLGSDGEVDVTLEPQTLLSPGYNEGTYPTFMQCSWLLTKTSGKTLIEFTDVDCAPEDQLTVYDGTDNTGVILMEDLCNATCFSGPIVSSSESLFVALITGGAGSHKGFAMKYVGGSGTGIADGSTESLRFTATEDPLYLSSSGFPSSYPSGISSTYIISSGHVTTPVAVILLFVEIDSTLPPCSGDKLEIYDGDVSSDGTDTQLLQTCTDSAAWPDMKMSSTGKFLSIVFTSNSADNGHGFLLQYSIERHCPVTVTELTANFEPQTLMNPGYEEGSYPLYMDCSWNISSNLVGVSILAELQVASLPCDTESRISLYDGLDTNEVLQADGCGIDVKAEYIAETGSLHISFVTGDDINTGFLLKYMAAKDESGTGTEQRLDATTEKQYISSPDFPMEFPTGPARTYVVSSGHALTPVSMKLLYINIQPSCTSNLEIFNGDKITETTATNLGQFCSNDEKWLEQENFTSTGQYLSAVFTAVYENRGFFLQYYVSYHCPDEENAITAQSVPGSLKSPGYDDDSHPKYMRCTWTITGNDGNLILLQMVDVALSTGASITIYNGNDTEGTLLQQLSSTSQTAPIVVADSGSAFIELKTEESADAPGFQLMYLASRDMSDTSHVTALDEDQYLTSTLFPQPFTGTTNDLWVISTNVSGKIIEVNFLFMDIAETSGCSSGDVLKIYDGEYTSGMEYSPTVIAAVCNEGSWSSVQYQSTGQYITVELELDADTSNNGHGYLLTYKHVDDQNSWDCPGGSQTLQASVEPATFESPGFTAGSYSSYLDCSWTVTSESGQKILFQIIDLAVTCETSAGIFVFDGADQQSSTLLQYVCGSSTLQPMISSANTLFVRFKTGSDTSGKGFQMTYIAGSDYSGEATSNVQSLDATTEKQYLSSPGFPAMYNINMERKYMISSGHKDTFVQLDVIFVDTEPDCAKDNVEVINGDLESANMQDILETFCSSDNNWPNSHFQSTGQYLSVTMTTDNAENRHGFIMSYYVLSHCPTSDLAPTADLVPRMLLSPGYEEGSYPTYLSCHWVITAAEGETILAQVTDIDIPCQNDVVIIFYDGTDDSGDVLQDNVCQSEEAQPVIVGESGKIFLTMTSAGSSNGVGFKMSFLGSSDLSGTGELLLAGNDKLHISSPLFPAEYSMSDNHTWIISSRSWFEVVTVEIVFMDIFQSADCLADSLEIYDGEYGTENKPRLIDRVCNKTDWEANRYSSTSQYISLVFKTRNSNHHGFLIKFWSVPDLVSVVENGQNDQTWHCPDETRSHASETTMKILTSPGYNSNNYGGYINCNWTITVKTGWKILFDVEVDIPCETGADFSITNDEQSTDSYLLKYGCGEKKDFGLFQSSSGNLYLRFRSQKSTANKGFRMKYMKTKEYHSSEEDLRADPELSFLSSKNFPFAYPKFVTYQWLINSGSSKNIVRIKVIFVDIMNTPGCTTDSLVFYDDNQGEREKERLCSEQDWTEKDVTSSGQYMTVVFTSGASKKRSVLNDTSSGKLGFLLSYTNATKPGENRNLADAHSAAVIAIGVICACFTMATFALMVAIKTSKTYTKNSPKHFDLYDLARTNQKQRVKRRYKDRGSHPREKPYDIYDEERARVGNSWSKNHYRDWNGFKQNKSGDFTTPKWIQMLNSKK